MLIQVRFMNKDTQEMVALGCQLGQFLYTMGIPDTWKGTFVNGMPERRDYILSPGDEVAAAQKGPEPVNG